MPRYALVDGEGRTVDVILWDGQTEYVPPEGLTLVPEDSAQPRVPSPSVEISSLGFFNKFTLEEQVAVMTACSQSPALHVGLVNGLAAGSVTLDSEKVTSWLMALVQIGAITEERRVEIQSP